MQRINRCRGSRGAESQGVQRVKGCRGVDVKLIAISILFHTVHISHIPCMSNMPSTS